MLKCGNESNFFVLVAKNYKICYTNYEIFNKREGAWIDMMHEFVTYADGTMVVSSDIRKKENGEEYIHVTFERPMEYGFDTVVFELPSYDIVEKGAHLFFKYARQGGLKFA